MLKARIMPDYDDSLMQTSQACAEKKNTIVNSWFTVSLVGLALLWWVVFGRCIEHTALQGVLQLAFACIDA